MLLENVDFDDFDLFIHDIRNPNKGTHTHLFSENSNYSSATSNRSIRTPTEGESRQEQQRQTRTSTGKSMDDVRYRTRMSIEGDLATMARVGGNTTYYTGQGIGQELGMAIDAYTWINEKEEDDNEDIQPPIDEEVYETTQGILGEEPVGAEAQKKEPVEVMMLLGYLEEEQVGVGVEAKRHRM